MVGLEKYVATKRSFVGIDWANMASGVLKGAGGAFGSGSGGDSSAAAAKAAADKAAAEQSASNWKLIGIGAVVVLGGLLLLNRRQPA